MRINQFCTHIRALLKNDFFTYGFCITPETPKYTKLTVLGAGVQGLPIVNKTLITKNEGSRGLLFLYHQTPGSDQHQKPQICEEYSARGV